MIHLRPEQPEDAAAIREVHRLAFVGDAEAGIVDAIRVAGAAVLSMVAVERPQGAEPDEAAGGGACQVVAHILYTWVTVTAEDGGDISLLGLAPVAVLPTRQNQGIGTMLVEASLERLRTEGHPAVVVVGHPAYYPRFGFLPGSRWGLRWEVEVPNSSIQNEVTPGAHRGRGRDGRVRGKDARSARSGATGATEDDASDRPVRTRRPRLRFESSSKEVFMAAELSPGSLAEVHGVVRFRPEFGGI